VSELVYLAFGTSPVGYLEGWDLQRRVHTRRVADEVPDSCLLLEHEPVYTAGKRTAASDRPSGDPGAPVVEVDRGGKITWHGPGQLTGYPIIKLREPLDVVAYVRMLEEALIRTCAEFGVTATRVEGRSGAWVRDEQSAPSEWAERKVGAIGARVARGVTMHGFALNCDCDLSWYDRIVPCGIRDAGVTTLSAEAGRSIAVTEVTPVMERHLAEVLGYQTRRHVYDPDELGRTLTPVLPLRLPAAATYSGGVVLAPEGRRMLRLEARNSQVPIERKPPWIKTRLRTGPSYTELKSLVRSEGLHTVCEEAGCPNIFECWEDREATFLIGGDQCTRRCDFCQIDTGKPEPLDTEEPRRVAESVAVMGLKYSTVTGVARDDLPDGGAWLYAQTCREIHAAIPGCGVELLIPDFNAVPDRLAEVFGARPEVLAHNIETVPRIFRRIRPGFRYPRSLDVLRAAREAGLVTKSNLILGMGEERAEITEAMKDLRTVGCDLLTITQYLRPTPRHHPVERWVKPEEFTELREEALELGFAGVMSGPLVRSSYRAGRLYAQAIEQRTGAAAPALG
jgi:lipoate synthase/lipoate-protein ligase B